MCRPPRRGRSPPLVASPLLFLPALFLPCPTDACEETITQFHLAVGGGGGGGGKKRERGDRKEKKKEPMQIKTKKVSPLLSFPFSSSFSPPSLAQRGRRDDKNKCKPGRRGRREGKKRREEFVGWRNWVMGPERGKGGEGTKIGRRKRSEDDKKGVPLLPPAPFPPFPFCDPIRLQGKGKGGRERKLSTLHLARFFHLSHGFLFFLDENGANSLKTSSFPTILTCHYLPLLSCNFLNFRQANVIRNLN